MLNQRVNISLKTLIFLLWYLGCRLEVLSISDGPNSRQASARPLRLYFCRPLWPPLSLSLSGDQRAVGEGTY